MRVTVRVRSDRWAGVILKQVGSPRQLQEDLCRLSRGELAEIDDAGIEDEIETWPQLEPDVASRFAPDTANAVPHHSALGNAP